MTNRHSDGLNMEAHSDITAEACAWIAQLETGDCTRADMEAFKEWVSRSPRHAAEIKRMAKLSMSLNSLNDLAPAMSEAAKQHRQVMKERRRQPKIWGAALAMSFAAFAFFAFIFMFSKPIETQQFYTRVGESKAVTLDDGSVVTLNTDSRIEVTFSDDNRIVKLLKGEVYFDVAANKQRPFWVYTNQDRVRVVGTEFLIRYLADNFKLMVTEGIVDVAKVALNTAASGEEQRVLITQSNNDDSLSLTAGQQIVLPHQRDGAQLSADLISLVSEKQQRQELSWQDGFHDFSDMALVDVAAEVSRYIPEQVIVTDDAVKDLKFSGIFRVGEPQVFFDALKLSYGLKVERLDGKTVAISKRS
ncbi:FecR domain-containing protein [Alteromonas sp. C1M14]|uniref:FecR family protein n=1 Tax=Alteromonas sp. C1M14 TaxID=2841567 RepID=UPI001C081CEA|nr:FecR domain-containing protein [Alteromonas sp. C1M14]MBU2978558.1 FecR domain-containing protein [Alteromonas sp. C1M14]